MASKTLEEIKAIRKELRLTQIIPDQSLLKKAHSAYMNFIIKDFREAVIYFDVAQPWLYYYSVHSLNLMGVELEKETKDKISEAVSFCENEGYAGGYKQQPHLAPTYASFLTLISLGRDYLDKIDKEKLYQFFKRVKKGDGRFMMSEMGECDIRGSYIVVILTKMLGLEEDILEGVAESILSSQTPEGGISNVVGGEAHGGFTFCAVAALSAMKRLHELDISRLIFWLSRRQVEFGGFNGRTNKLIDSCYSFWIGSCFAVLNDHFERKISYNGSMLYAQQDLQKYILLYCQDKRGGLTDKPGKMRDCYHTLYALSGLSLSQENGFHLNGFEMQENQPVYNVTKEKYEESWDFYNTQQKKEKQEKLE